MATLLAILVRGNPADSDMDLVPSDVLTGMHLLRMLQKHYQQHDLGFFQPLANHPHRVYNHIFVFFLNYFLCFLFVSKQRNPCLCLCVCVCVYLFLFV